MKKFLLTAVLILAVLTSLTAGTLANYTMELAPFQVTGVAKAFNFYADSSMSANTQIKIAPGEAQEYSVVLQQRTEVPVNYTATMSFLGGDADFYTRLGAPTVTYTVDGAAGSGISISGNKVTLPTIDAGNRKIVITFRCAWASQTGDIIAAGKSATMNVTVKGEQKI